MGISELIFNEIETIELTKLKDVKTVGDLIQLLQQHKALYASAEKYHFLNSKGRS